MPESIQYAAVIPIRSGSKSIPHKNIRPLLGKPLFYWATQAALESRVFGAGVYVAVDCQEYFDLVRTHTPEAKPLFRPEHTATDTASSESVMLWFAETLSVDVVSLVQVTTPTLTAQDFIDARDRFESEGADSLLTGVPFPRFLWTQDGTALNYDPLHRPRRQDFHPSLVENGAFYFTKTTLLKEVGCRLGGKIVVHPMSEETFVEIDEPKDWEKVEQVLVQRGVGQNSSTSKTRVVAVDVDGTLTDGGMYYGPEGEIMKKFNTKDGAALGVLRDRGYEVVVCTGEDSPAVESRLRKLGIGHYLKGVKDKVKELDRWLVDHRYTWDQVLYVGDDLNDLGAIRRAGYSVCPLDAHPEILQAVRRISGHRGGDGVLREVAGLLVEAGGAG